MNISEERKEKIKRADRQISALILINNYAKRLLNDYSEDLKETVPELWNLVRKDIKTLDRNYDFLLNKFPEAKCADMCIDHEKISEILDQFIDTETLKE